MRKVLHLRSSGQLLGAERVVLELAKFLPDFGYEVVIGIPVEDGYPEPEFAVTAKKMGLNVFTFPIKGAFDLSAAKKIKAHIEQEGIDIIHSHGYREDLYAVMARKGCPLVATNHLWKRTSFRLKLYAYLDAWLLKKFNAIIAVSELVEADMIAQGISRKLIRYVPNGIDTDSFAELPDKTETRALLGIPNDATVFGTLSSLSTEKGIRYLLEAASTLRSKYESMHLVITGDGPENEALRQLTRTLGLEDRVSFLGRREDIKNVLSCYDVFMLPSLSEGLPMAMLEAMAAGLPVIATAVGAVPEVVTEAAGYVVNPENASELAQSMQALLDSNDLIGTLGEGARKRVVESFSSSTMAKVNASIYDQLEVR